MDQFIFFAAVGFLAQLVDGALGMAYGLVSATVLLTFGVPPATVSASVHAAELFTTGVSSVAHHLHRNIDRNMFWRLVPAGVLGGILGAYLLSGIMGEVIRPYVVLYLGLMGIMILFRAIRSSRPRLISAAATGGFGLMGGFCDAIGGGGWGPMVTSALMARGGEPRYVIGTVNAAEFFLTLSISATFAWAFFSGHWTEASGLLDHAAAVGGLIAGGIVAAPITSYLAKHVPARSLLVVVGTLVLVLSVYQSWQLLV